MVLFTGGLALAVAGLMGPSVSGLRLIALIVGLVGMCLAFSPRNLMRLALAVGVSVLMGCALLELGLQYLGEELPPTLCQADPSCLYRLEPGGSKVHRAHRLDGGREVSVSINTDGYRGAELRPAGEARRVLICGDSFIEADAVRLDETFVQALQRRLADGLGVDVECVNAGVNGYGPDQSLARLEADLDLVNPELVVLGVFAGNDFGDLVRNRLVALGESGELSSGEHVLGRDALGQLNNRGFLRLPRLLRRGIARLPELLASVGVGTAPVGEAHWRASWEPMLEQQRRDYQQSVVDGDPEIWNLLHDYYDLDITLDPGSPSAGHKRRLMEAVLAEFARTCRERDVSVMVLVIPAAIDVCDGWAFRELAQDLYPAYRPSAATDAVVAAAQASALSVVDLFGPFDEREASELYYRFDDHWNAAGQALAAELVEQAIREHGLF